MKGMTSAKSKTKAEIVAQNLGDFPETEEALYREIQRLRQKEIVHLEQVKKLHNWLEGKRHSRQCCRVVGESRTGKTISCNAYCLRHKPSQEPGKPPIVPVVYIEPPQDCGSVDLFRAIIEYLRYKVQSKERVRELRSRAMKVLERCKVETLIIDEADRLKPKTFAEVRDIFDKLEISVVLVGTDRLDTVIKRDEQVYNRFRACYRFGKLTGKEFEQVVMIWERDILRLPVPSNLHNSKMLKILAQATGGYIGLLDMILREAGIRALEKRRNQIDLETLKKVAGEYS